MEPVSGYSTTVQTLDLIYYIAFVFAIEKLSGAVTQRKVLGKMG